MSDSNSNSLKDINYPQKYLLETLALLTNNPTEAANRFEDIGMKFIDLAKKVREYSNTNTKDGIKDDGGTNDRVQMKVVGPDGNVKQSIDTGKIP